MSQFVDLAKRYLIQKYVMMVTSKLEKRALVTKPASGCGHGFVVRDLDLLLFLLSFRVDPRPLDLFEFLWLGTFFGRDFSVRIFCLDLRYLNVFAWII